jgi:hypothetical protein
MYCNALALLGRRGQGRINGRRDKIIPVIWRSAVAIERCDKSVRIIAEISRKFQPHEPGTEGQLSERDAERMMTVVIPALRDERFLTGDGARPLNVVAWRRAIKSAWNIYAGKDPEAFAEVLAGMLMAADLITFDSVPSSLPRYQQSNIPSPEWQR